MWPHRLLTLRHRLFLTVTVNSVASFPPAATWWTFPVLLCIQLYLEQFLFSGRRCLEKIIKDCQSVTVGSRETANLPLVFHSSYLLFSRKINCHLTGYWHLSRVLVLHNNNSELKWMKHVCGLELDSNSNTKKIFYIVLWSQRHLFYQSNKLI